MKTIKCPECRREYFFLRKPPRFCICKHPLAGTNLSEMSSQRSNAVSTTPLEVLDDETIVTGHSDGIIIRWYIGFGHFAVQAATIVNFHRPKKEPPTIPASNPYDDNIEMIKRLANDWLLTKDIKGLIRIWNLKKKLSLLPVLVDQMNSKAKVLVIPEKNKLVIAYCVTKKIVVYSYDAFGMILKKREKVCTSSINQIIRTDDNTFAITTGSTGFYKYNLDSLECLCSKRTLPQYLTSSEDYILDTRTLPPYLIYITKQGVIGLTNYVTAISQVLISVTKEPGHATKPVIKPEQKPVKILLAKNNFFVTADEQGYLTTWRLE